MSSKREHEQDPPDRPDFEVFGPGIIRVDANSLIETYKARKAESDNPQTRAKKPNKGKA